MSKVWEHTLDEYEQAIKNYDTHGAAILRALLLPQLERPSAKVDPVAVKTFDGFLPYLTHINGCQYGVMFIAPGETEARAANCICGLAKLLLEQKPALYMANKPWCDWPTEHLLRKIAMPEGFVNELRKRLVAHCECPEPMLSKSSTCDFCGKPALCFPIEVERTI